MLKSQKKNKLLSRTLTYIVLILAAVICLFPFLWMISTSFKPMSDIYKMPEWSSVTKEQEPTMIFDKECEVRNNFDDCLLEKVDSILPPFNLMAMMAETNVQH